MILLRPADRRTGKWSGGGETQERSRSETTVARAAGGSTPIIRLIQMPLVTSALFAERNRRGREGDRADHQPVKWSKKARWSRRMAGEKLFYNAAISSFIRALSFFQVFTVILARISRISSLGDFCPFVSSFGMADCNACRNASCPG